MKRATVLMAALLACAYSHARDVDLAIVTFDPGIPESDAAVRDLGIFPRIREVEALVWPFRLREVIVAGGGWGIVRIQPEAPLGAELVVRGTISQSNATDLSLAVVARDASGAVWLDERYSATLDGGGERGLDGMFRQIAKDLAGRRDALDRAALESLDEIAVLRYAEVIAPTAFEGYLSHQPDGRVELLRLPARDDPMIRRIRLVRETEFVVNDVLDEKYREINDEIGDVLALWQAYRRKNIDYQGENQRRAVVSAEDVDFTSYESVKRMYDVYKWDRLTSQEQDRLAVAFNNEVGPRVATLEQRVAELQVFIDQKYAEWNRILEALYEVETRRGDNAR